MFKKMFFGMLLGVCLISFSGVGAVYAGKEYIGSRSTKKYHYKWCKLTHKILPENKIAFASPKEALAAGYAPCTVCKPGGGGKKEGKKR